MSEPPAVSRHEPKMLAHWLADLEILYLLSFEPITLSDLAGSLRTTFGISTTPEQLHDTLGKLEAEKTVTVFRNPLREEGAMTKDAYAITASGLRILSESIESLSEIALTMQLGFNQGITRTD